MGSLRRGSSPRGGGLILKGAAAPLSVDLDHDGVKEVVAAYSCSAGGVTWPVLPVVYGRGPRVLGSVDLGRLGGRFEHADILGWKVAGSQVQMSWSTHDGAGSDRRFHLSRLSMVHGRVQLTEVRPVMTTDRIAISTTQAFMRAAVAGDRRIMTRLATPRALAVFDSYGHHWSEPSRPTVEGDSGTDTPMVQGVILSGPPAAGNYGLIFGFTVTINPDGGARITSIVNQGDAG